ncbi:4'-phosphopantetheinyl transferase [Shewanella sairae]|uniref:4'-phosphopantetheinyl transferase n=1 Tax=Shewanella sairae TaxID=190310 RepID=A0ABQ4PQH7_9GAMM|nr:4'-phosphopantetheinyl transferase superfamily protein [Shewanella sairae]GIU51439.1 4'-phosphopantetheinyl transferase [Shewanella sairae]
MPESYSISLYFCPLTIEECDDQASELLKSWLPEDELVKVDRYIKQEVKIQGLLVRGYLRALLSQHSDLLPNEWCFEYGDKGKPRLTDTQFKQTGIHFNLSHSGDWLLVGICVPNAEKRNNLDAVEFGVDIERCRSSTNIHAILSHYFSEPEKAALLALPAELQRERFFDLWALKESYIKAKGLGLALSLKSFAFDFSPALEASLTVNSWQGDHSINSVDVRANNNIDSSVGLKELLFLQNIGLALQSRLNEDVAEGIIDSKGSGEQAAEQQDTLSTMITAKDWHCWLGHLDESYRFALSIGPCEKVRVNAFAVDLRSLLAGFEL